MGMGCENSLQAVVAGHICLDITPGLEGLANKGLKDILAPGKLTNISGVKLSTGGAVSNTGVALTMLGVNTRLMGKTGNDYFGEGILRLLKTYGAGEGMLIAEGAQTSYSIILVPPGTDRIFLHDPGANDTFCADDINYDMVGQAKLFHFGYPTLMKRMYEDGGKELIEIFKRVKSLGVTTSLDMSLPDPASASGKVDWYRVFQELLPYVDIFIPSIEETLYMIMRDKFVQLNEACQGADIIDQLDMNLLPEAGKRLLDMGVRIAAIKCGKKGYYVRTSNEGALEALGRAKPGNMKNWVDRELIEETYQIPRVLSGTGAGDTSIAGFLAAFLRGMDIEDCLKLACATGAECVQAYDALSGIKPLDESISMIQKGWKKNRITISGNYWRYDTGKSHWIGKMNR